MTAVALAPFALFFTIGAVLTPVAAVCIAFGGNWNLAAIVLASGLLYALFAIPLCWLAFRLFRGHKSANGVTILPTWLIRIFLLAFLGPLSVGIAAGMLLWAYEATMDGDWTMGLLLAVGACGFVVSLIRAFPVAFRLGNRAYTDGSEQAAEADGLRD